jgi:hypothetical protein
MDTHTATQNLKLLSVFLLFHATLGCGWATSWNDNSLSPGTSKSLIEQTTQTWVGEDGQVKVSYPDPATSNSVAFAQIPGTTKECPNSKDMCSQFLGRWQDPDGNHWGIINYLMDWNQNDLTTQAYAFPPNQSVVGGYYITSAYDPTIAEFNGKLWAAFECAGNGIVGSASCVGPYDLTTGQIDASQTTVVVNGTPYFSSDPYIYSGSVPKILAFQGALYMYWSVVKQQPGVPPCASDNPGCHWASITTRGAQLDVNSGLAWAVGTSSTISAVNPNLTTEVWGLLPDDDESNLTADTQGVYTDGEHVFAIAGLGGNADGKRCLNPLIYNAGCYRTVISRSSSALGPEIFTYGDQLPNDEVVSNAMDYLRLVVLPDGTWNLMGIFYGIPADSYHYINQGLWRFSIPDWTFFQKNAVPSGVARLSVPMAALEGLSPGCTPGLSQACETGASRFCRESNDYTAGFGPVQIGSNLDAAVVCLGADVATRESVTFAQLSTELSQCNGPDVAGSIFCHAAVNRYCQENGFESGLPIEEYSATTASFACVKTTASQRFSESWSTLSGEYGGCTLANQSEGFSCLPAADDECGKLGYVSGFGALEISQTDAQILCVGPKG